jgi:HK97 family phage major capsid protein
VNEFKAAFAQTEHAFYAIKRIAAAAGDRTLTNPQRLDMGAAVTNLVAGQQALRAVRSQEGWWSPDDEAEYLAFMKQATEQARAINDGEASGASIEEWLERSANATEQRPPPVWPSDTGSGAWQSEDGTVRALTPTESLTPYFGSWPTAGLPEFGAPIGLNGLLRGLVTGQWPAGKTMASLGVGTDSAGGFLVPGPLAGRVIDKARNQARIFQAGALTVPMQSSTLKIARVATDPTAAWKAENAQATASDMTFEALTLTARSLIAIAKLSIELMEDSPTINDVVENAMAQALALELDRAALYGSGTAPEPRGIINTSGVGIQSQGTNGAALTSYDAFSTAVQTIQAANGDPNAVIYAARTAGTLDRLKDSTGQPLQPPQSFRELTKLVTSQVPVNRTHGAASNASDAFVGEWPELLVGVRTQLRIEASRVSVVGGESAFDRLQVHVRAYLRADIGVAQPSHFVVVTGIIP